MKARATLAALTLCITPVGADDPVDPPATISAVTQPVIETPCHEDQVAIVVHHTFQPTAETLGYWDGDRYYRLCVNVDDMTIVDGEFVPNIDQ